MKVVSEFDLSEIDLEVSGLPEDVRQHLLMQIARNIWDGGDAYWDILDQALESARLTISGGDIGVLGSDVREFRKIEPLVDLVVKEIDYIKCGSESVGEAAVKLEVIAERLMESLKEVQKAIDSLAKG